MPVCEINGGDRRGRSISICRRRSSKVDPNDTDQLTLQLLENSFSRQLVAEMMILAGEVGAKYAKANHIPVPYRFQEQPDSAV
jgi:exoribonuclease R